MKQLPRATTGIESVDAVIEQIRTRLNELAGDPRASRRTLSGVTLNNGSVTLIRHGLGKRWSGYQITAQRGATAAGYINYQSGADEDKYLRLLASGFGAALTVDIEVW